jgi:hypothetical protein
MNTNFSYPAYLHITMSVVLGRQKVQKCQKGGSNARPSECGRTLRLLHFSLLLSQLSYSGDERCVKLVLMKILDNSREHLCHDFETYTIFGATPDSQR